MSKKSPLEALKGLSDLDVSKPHSGILAVGFWPCPAGHDHGHAGVVFEQHNTENSSDLASALADFMLKNPTFKKVIQKTCKIYNERKNGLEVTTSSLDAFKGIDKELKKVMEARDEAKKGPRPGESLTEYTKRASQHLPEYMKKALLEFVSELDKDR